VLGSYRVFEQDEGARSVGAFPLMNLHPI